MLERVRVGLSITLALLLPGMSACATPAPTPGANQPAPEGSHDPAPGPSASARPVASTTPVAALGPCDGLSGLDAGVVRVSERLTVGRGKSFTSATGLQVSFLGTDHDSYADGRTDQHVSLVLSAEGRPGEGWQPSILGKQHPALFLGHCLWIAEASEQTLAVDVALPVATEPLKPCAGAATLVTDYSELTEGERFTIAVRRAPERGDWVPEPTLKMPRHHSSRLGWLGLQEIPGLAMAGSSALRFTIQVTTRRVQQVSKRRAWRAEYVARVLSACVL